MKSQISKAIDPKRVGISKSTIVATSLCARKGWYGETVRDGEGRRLSVPMPERVLFGTGLDEAISTLLFNARQGALVTPTLQEECVEEGLAAVASRAGGEDLDPVAMELELRLAVARFVDDVLPSLPLDGMRLQGDDGESLRHGDYIGTPDILVLGDAPAVWDVKSSPRSKSARDLYSAEMAHYASLYHALYGALPTVGYLTWVRGLKAGAKWQVVYTQATVLHLALADAYRGATKTALRAASVDDLPFNTALCGTCEWKVARPELGFGGCAVGQAVDELAGKTEEGGTEQ